MPKATDCKLGKKSIDVEEAIDLRRDTRKKGSPRPDFRCLSCSKPVRPHKAGDGNPAHFEHLARNRNCPLSHRAR